jgi:hypothetical protein
LAGARRSQKKNKMAKANQTEKKTDEEEEEEEEKVSGKKNGLAMGVP